VDELADSAHLVNDADGLRRRLADHDYLFFRGLLAAGPIRAAGHAVLAQLRSGGWVDDRALKPTATPKSAQILTLRHGVAIARDRGARNKG
jgi:hypothetical protein